MSYPLSYATSIFSVITQRYNSGKLNMPINPKQAIKSEFISDTSNFFSKILQAGPRSIARQGGLNPYKPSLTIEQEFTTLKQIF